MEGSVNLSRRGFLRARVMVRAVPVRPPWALAEEAFLAACTRCDACVGACPNHIVVRGEGGFAEIDFTRGECSFCRACVTACEPQALLAGEGKPWRILPEIGSMCLAQKNVVCRSCGDACEARALRFVPRLGGAALPELNAAACTGCGACVGACPAQAVMMEIGNQTMEARQ